MNLNSFLPHQHLSTKFWKDNKMKEAVRERLLFIADAFIDYLGIDIDVVDITMTGSYANYNYTQYSDVDLHIIVDPANINKDVDLVEEFLKAKRQYWNEKHDINMFGVEVELYPQDINEDHKSSGVYSVKDDKWIVEPKQFSEVSLSNDIIKKANVLRKRIDQAIDKSKEERDPDELDQVIQKIRKMRQSGLENGGEYSEENMVYKILRSEGYVDKMYKMKDNIFDIKLSVGEID